MARFLKAQRSGVWNSPVLKPKWRDALGAKVSKAIVMDDSPVLEGKWPVRPSDFPIDPHHEKEADDAVEKWRNDKKRQGLDYAASSASVQSLTPLCPEVDASASFGDGHLRGTLVTFDACVATIAVGGVAADSVSLPASCRRIELYDDSSDGSGDDSNDGDSWLGSVPAWALEHVLMQVESTSTIVHQVIICDEELVVLDERVDLPGVEESEDHPAVEASVELHYTVIVKTHRLSVGSPGKAIGTAVTGVEVGTTASGTSVAVLKRQMNGAVLVIEAGACLADHYLIQPSETAAAAARGASGGPDADGHADPNADTHTEPPHSTAITSGVIIGFCRLSEAYAAYKIDADGSSYWLPITLFTDSDATTTTATDDNEKQFGQIGGEFYVRLANGKREHVQTALRKCQTWVDHASHNRSERFRVKRRQQNGELSPLGYYALIEGTGEHANLLFRIRTLDKLVKKTDGYSAWLPSASFDTPDVQVQWTEYEQRDDGLYIRTARQSDQQPLDNMPMAIAMKVTLVEADGVSGGTLSEDSSASLLKLSLIDERSARSVREVAVLAPPKLRNNTQPVPFDFDTSRTVTSISDSSRFPGENHPA